MNMYIVKVNETHVCVLRKEENENRAKVDFVQPNECFVQTI